MDAADRDIVNTSELITRLHADGVGQFARQTITHWTRLPDNPMPVHYQGKPGQSNKYDYDDVLQWYADNRARLEPGEDAASYDVERTRYMRAKAEMAEMAAEELRSELVRAADVQKSAYQVARDIRQAFAAMPDRIAAELAVEKNEIKIVEILRNEIAEILTALMRLQQAEIEKSAKEIKKNEPDKSQLTD